MKLITDEFGEIEIATVPAPDGVRVLSATYTVSGRVFVFYRTAEDPEVDDWYNAAVVDDDGQSFTNIFSGRIPQRATANGIRHMPFADNSRILLGDYVLECSPNIDACEHTALVEVDYPWNLAGDPLTSHHWSEIIVSPDDHIAWTALRTDLTAIVALGRLHRDDDRYVIDDPTIISSTDLLVPDADRPGYFATSPMRGGEVKQFVHGGAAISAVGDGGGALTDSVVQDLATGSITRITQAPGYDETTIFSPDERLGMVMTSRASRGTNPAFLGLLPRPHANLVGMTLAWTVYTYTVQGVRAFREGNIGPVLIDIHRSMTEPDYVGVALNDPDETWVYCSPMSWHPDGRRSMWMEMARGSGLDGAEPNMRIRIAKLLDREARQPVGPSATPDDIAYGIRGHEAEELLTRAPEPVRSGRIAGARSGYLEFEREFGGLGGTASAMSRYVDYSDDGRCFYNGVEKAVSSMAEGTVYEVDLELTGEERGEMRVRARWSGIRDGARLLFEPDEEGLPRTRGHVRYGETYLSVDDLVP